MARVTSSDMRPWGRGALTIPPNSASAWIQLAMWELWMGMLVCGALGLGVFLLAPLGLLGVALLVEFFLAVTLLFLDHRTVEVRLLATHLDRDRAGPALRRGELDLLLRLALQRDLARSRGILLATVRAAQVRQEVHLGFVADDVVRAADPDAGLAELHEQLLDRNLQDLGELRDRHFCHVIRPPLTPAGPVRTNACARRGSARRHASRPDPGSRRGRRSPARRDPRA